MDLQQLEQRLGELEGKVESKFSAIDAKLDSVLELVQLGKGMLLVAKIGGWLIAIGAAAIEVWRAIKGNGGPSA